MRLGIDFGTCFSSAAFMDGETLTFVKDPSSASFSIPSSVFANAQGQVLVGTAADRRRLSDPARYRRELKRDLGRSARLLQDSFLPEQLIAHILGKIKRDADAQMSSLGKPLFSGAVLTIPATYPEHKSNLMLKAAAEAGFSAAELTLLREPVAAALYYAHQSKMADGEVLLVYDLGGGTFDAALLQKNGEDFKYLAVPVGIEHCGGVDFDRAIYNDLIRQQPELQAILSGQRQDKPALALRITIGEDCIDLKHQLSYAEDAEFSFVAPDSGDFIEYTLTRAAFEQMIASPIQETLTCCQNMLQQAGVGHEQISRILLVGGSCRIPYVQRMLQDTFHCPISVAPDLELVVCQGAALYATQHLVSVVSVTPGEAEYTTINAALQQAKPGTHIVVRPGIYQEDLYLDRDVEISGAGPREQIVIESNSAIAIQMATTSAKVRGITLKHCSSEAFSWVTHGAVVVAQGHLQLEDCALQASFHGVSVWGEGSQVTLRGCCLRGGKNANVAINHGARGWLEDCDIAGNEHAGVHVRDQGSSAAIVNCTIHDGLALGISISAQGQAEIEGCDFFGNAHAAIQVCDNGSVAEIQGNCRVHNERDKGVAVWSGGRAIIEACSFFENLYAGVFVSDYASSASITRCQMYDGRLVGVDVAGQGEVTIEDCELFHNAGPAIRVRDEGSRASIQRCKIHEGRYEGVVIQEQGQAQLDENEVLHNVGPGIRVCRAGKATANHCTIQGNAVGALVEQEGTALLHDCTIEQNRTATYVEPGSVLREVSEDGEEAVGSDNCTESDVSIWRQTPKPEPVKFFNTVNPAELTFLRELSYHAGAINSMVISPDGQTLISGSNDQTIKVWQLSTGQNLRAFSGHTGAVQCVASSPDGRILVSGSDDKTVKIWENSPGQLLQTLSGHTGAVRCVAISPDGRTLVSGSQDATIMVWDVSTGKLVRTLSGHEGAVWSVAISPDRRTLVSGSQDATIKIWQLSTGQLLQTLSGHTHYVRSVAISPDGRTLVSGSQDRTIMVWDVSTGQILRALTGHGNSIHTVVVSSDGETIISGSHDNTIKFWSLTTGQLLHTLSGHNTSGAVSIAVSPDGQTIAGGQYNLRYKSLFNIGIWGK
jgi:WD40 repeat protein/actin-like ATPase involved in cell morphogenesis